jgi:hypothetical protein
VTDSEKLDAILAEQARVRPLLDGIPTIHRAVHVLQEEVRRLRIDQRDMRDEMRLTREQVRFLTDRIGRLDDTVSMNVLDRLQALEARE